LQDVDASLVGPTSGTGERRSRSVEARILRHAFDQFPGILVLYDAERRIRSVNVGLERASGRTRAELIGRRDEELFPESLTRHYLPQLERAAATGEPVSFRATAEIDGAERTWAVEYIPMADDSGAVVTVLGIARDLTRRMRALEDRERSEARFQAFMDNGPATAFLKDDLGRYVYANEQAVRASGVPRERFLGRTDAELFPADIAARFLDTDEQVRATLATVARVERIEDGGDARTWLVYKFPVTDPDGSRYVGAWALDISDRQREAEERARMEHRLMEAQRLESLAVLAGGVAHDFNNLLAGILGSASFARREPGSPRIVCDALERIEETSLRAAELCSQMLAYAGKGRLHVEPVDLAGLARGTIALLGSSVASRAEVVLDIDPRTRAVRGDATQLRQVIMNLLVNASDALAGRRGTITVRVAEREIDAAELAGALEGGALVPGPHVVLEIRDDGEGMDADTRARAFDPFFSTKFSGRGLGLAAVRGIVRGHGAAIGVASAPDRGSTFRVYFPPSDEPAAPSPAVPRPVEVSDRLDGPVLLADDEGIVREVARNVLESMGFDVLEARDGLEAVELFGRHAPEIRLVILDLTMPRLDGALAWTRMRAVRSGVPVLVTSGYTEEESLARFTGPGVRAFLHKPFRASTLRDKVRELLGSAQA